MFKGKFKDIVAKDDGFLRGPFGSALKNLYLYQNLMILIRYMNKVLYLNKIILSGIIIYLKEYYDSKMSRFATKAGDFLVSCSGVNYGAIYQLPNDSKNGVINQALLRIRLNNDIIDNDYFLYYFNTYISKVITGGTGDSTILIFHQCNMLKILILNYQNWKFKKN